MFWARAPVFELVLSIPNVLNSRKTHTKIFSSCFHPSSLFSSLFLISRLSSRSSALDLHLIMPHSHLCRGMAVLCLMAQHVRCMLHKPSVAAHLTRQLLVGTVRTMVCVSDNRELSLRYGAKQASRARQHTAHGRTNSSSHCTNLS